MKKIGLRIRLPLAIGAMLFVACTGDDGSAGPAGPSGAQGAAGPAGPLRVLRVLLSQQMALTWSRV